MNDAPIPHEIAAWIEGERQAGRNDPEIAWELRRIAAGVYDGPPPHVQALIDRLQGRDAVRAEEIMRESQAMFNEWTAALEAEDKQKLVELGERQANLWWELARISPDPAVREMLISVMRELGIFGFYLFLREPGEG